MNALTDCIGHIERALHDETEALIAGDADRVAANSTVKGDLLRRFTVAMNLAPPEERGRATRRIALARELNDRNALLLAARYNAVRARAEALLQMGGPATYGADGRLKSSY